LNCLPKSVQLKAKGGLRDPVQICLGRWPFLC
jgi:hypothetical protein